MQAGKQRIVEAIGLGVLTNEEAAVKLAELRKQEQRLIIELSSIAEKTTIIAEWQAAIESLKGQNIEKQLLVLAKKKPVAFRRLLSLIFEPNSLRVKTFQVKSREWGGALESYKLTETMENMGNMGVFLETNPGFVV